MGEVFTYILLAAVVAGMLSLEIMVLRILWKLDLEAWRDLRARWQQPHTRRRRHRAS